MENYLLEGDTLDPAGTDLIAQTTYLLVGKPVPEGWRVLGGNMHMSLIARVAYRAEIEMEQDAND